MRAHTKLTSRKASHLAWRGVGGRGGGGPVERRVAPNTDENISNNNSDDQCFLSSYVY